MAEAETQEGPRRKRPRQPATVAELEDRRFNEGIGQGGREAATAVFTRERSHLGRGTTIELPLPDRDAVRTGLDRLLVAPGHDIGAVDRFVERHPGHLVAVRRASAVDMADGSDARAR